jgi:hypothetical protein
MKEKSAGRYVDHYYVITRRVQSVLTLGQRKETPVGLYRTRKNTKKSEHEGIRISTDARGERAV